jgi:long-chain acyl-CoA synthetase
VTQKQNAFPELSADQKGDGAWRIDMIAPSATTAFVKDGERWTYEQFRTEIDRLAAGLLIQGINPGDRIALHLRNGHEIAAAYYACFRVGAIAAPLNLRFKTAELEDALRRIRPSLYIGDADLYGFVAETDTAILSAEARYITGAARHGNTRPWTSLLAEPESGSASRQVDENAPAILLLTSGTTGEPKLVAHSIATLKAAANHMQTLGTDQGGVIAFVRPMVHASGLLYLLCAIRNRMMVVLLDTTDPDLLLDAIETHRCTYLPVPLVSCQALTERQREKPRDISSLKACAISADISPPGRQEAFREVFGLPLKSFWASTEGSFPFTYGTQSGAVGRPHPTSEVKLIADDGAAVAVGEIGELLVRGRHVMLGYWSASGKLQGLEDGWYHSGDMMRQDENGEFWFASRRKDLIVRAGSNISPLEIEQILMQHPDVRDAAVIGIPDATLGQRVIAFIELKAGATPESLAAVLEATRSRLADYKTPERLVQIENIPRNPFGKTDRKLLASAFQQLTFPAL